jgi:hypothetical protein
MQERFGELVTNLDNNRGQKSEVSADDGGRALQTGALCSGSLHNDRLLAPLFLIHGLVGFGEQHGQGFVRG